MSRLQMPRQSQAIRPIALEYQVQPLLGSHPAEDRDQLGIREFNMFRTWQRHWFRLGSLQRGALTAAVGDYLKCPPWRIGYCVGYHPLTDTAQPFTMNPQPLILEQSAHLLPPANDGTPTQLP